MCRNQAHAMTQSFTSRPSMEQTLSSFKNHGPTPEATDACPRAAKGTTSSLPSPPSPQYSAQATTDMICLRLNTNPQIHITNVYRQPGQGIHASLDPLLTMEIRHNSIIAGGFNLVSQRWNQQCPPSSGIGTFEEWVDDNALNLCMPANSPTHRRGNMIDLVWSDMPGVYSHVEHDLHSGSDHSTVVTTVNLAERLEPPRSRFIPDMAPHMAIDFVKRLNRIPPPPLSASPGQLDTAVRTGIATLHDTLVEICPPKRVSPGAPRKPYWNQECATARSERNNERRRSGIWSPEYLALAKALRSATSRAARAFRRRHMDEVKTPEAAHKVMGYYKKNSRFAPPPLVHEGHAYCTPAERADIFLRTKLLRPASTGDLHFDDYSSVSPRIIDFPPAAFEREQAPEWRAWLMKLFDLCLATGYHPTPFREAQVVPIPKPHKEDLTSPANWRPISLLPTIGKGIESLVARRLSNSALIHRLTSSQLCGGLPGRSATDLVESLVHRIEHGLQNGEVSSLVTLDIEAAYDSVLPGRLACRLLDYGFPIWVCRWARSFASNRSAHVRVDSFIAPTTQLEHGLPQGSPVSPILFLLFIAPMHDSKMLFGYVDDAAMLGRASTLAKAAAQAAWLANQAIAWGAQNGPSFSQGKTELQHFHRSSGREPTVVIDGTTIQPNKETRWLGIHLDTKLSFHAHVKHMTAKATRAAAHARSLANIIRGVPANLLRLAACAAIFPVLLYGVSVWFHGPQKFLAKGRVGPARQQQLVDMVTKAVAGTARAIIPAYCTTPHAALFREAGILPARVMLDRCRRQAAVRIASLDELHPLARLARARTSTRLTLRHRELPRAPPATRILPLAYPPPKPPEPKDARRIRAAKSRIARIPYCDLQVFSDGSKLQDGSTGAAAALYIAGLELPTVSTHLGKMMEVYDAELIGALAGLKATLQSPAATFAENVIVMLDNQEAAYRLLVGQPTLTSQDIILDFRATADRWPLRTRNSMSPGPGKVIVQWIPGHTDIPGNEAADRAAKAAASTPPPEHHESVSSLAALASWARSQHLKNVTAYWHGNIPGTYLELQIPWGIKFPDAGCHARDSSLRDYKKVGVLSLFVTGQCKRVWASGPVEI
ncbi:uncharacterized protein BROUX77_003119 [Berkeleyomyces rouxiae]|uniref:uncharacterized protein n=1 Tax=Berkeleyomyces rouxiae TaxID=2035830 RepID=UPI003B7CDE5B